ncbi:uncharacterized protein LOC132637185 [Lycium barbarum]|uniref:uncharacterized protein LOC132637185 n=1 Tax=Lycium barbarum TaxID=112863 RepID=UPI00293F375F|nr:uncharacterized protein LOC132637185 [Lycium barbarum]
MATVSFLCSFLRHCCHFWQKVRCTTTFADLAWLIGMFASSLHQVSTKQGVEEFKRSPISILDKGLLTEKNYHHGSLGSNIYFKPLLGQRLNIPISSIESDV